MMFGARLEITLKMHLDGTLHIGSGVSEEDPSFRSEKAKKDPEVTEVQRDKDGNAIIPATSLKGALRAQAPLGKSELDALLGEAGEAEERKGRIARLWFNAAIAAPMENACLQGMTKNKGLRNQGFVKTAVRIDRKSGTGEDKHLYNQVMIGPGVVFTAEAILFLDRGDEAVLRAQFARLLAPLASDPGLLIGAQHRQAGGRLRLDNVKITRRSINPATLDFAAKPEPDLGRSTLREAASIGPRADHEAYRLRLTCDGPFISMRDAATEEGEIGEVTQPLRQPDDKPLLWPSSLLGALRTRAAWLAEVQRLRANRGAPSDHPLDRRDHVIRGRNEIAALSSVERLFGISGWRGLVTVASLKAAGDCPITTHKVKSVTIDRFTGGGIDERLFTERIFLGSTFICNLRLETRAKDKVDEAGRTADQDLFDLLLADIEKKGLELGHGTAKGFGWFKVQVKKISEESSQ